MAVDIPEDEKSRAASLMNSLQGPGVKWTGPHNLHVTLKFIGETPDASVEKIGPAIGRAARSVARFRASLGGVGAFPDMAHPKIIWVGVKEGQSELGMLAEKVESELAAVEFPRADRLFSPHITIGRAKEGKALKDVAVSLQKAVYAPGEGFPVERVALYKSTLTKTGPLYEKIREAMLGPVVSNKS